MTEFSEGCCTLDLQVKRWEGSKWDNGSGNAQNQSYDWNVPLYAPASGVIASCWRNFPDDNNDQIFTGGNHVAIVTDKGNVISLNHLKQGTIPKELCPSNAGNQQYPDTMKKEDGWRVAAYIKPSDRPRVQEGQLIGRVGEFGNAKGPHLHMSLHRVTDPGDDTNRTKTAEESSPLNIRYAWAHSFHENQQVTAGGWFRLRGTDFAKDAGCLPDCNKMLHASPYLRRADADAGRVKHSDVLFLSGNRAVTASISADDGKLKLIAWDLVGVDQIVRKGEIEAGAAKEVALAEVASDHVLAAVRQADDTLKMIAFRVGATGNLQRLDDMSAGKVAELDMVAFGDGKRAATAVRGPADNFKLIVWDIETGGSPKIVRLGEADAGTVAALSIAPARPFNGVFTAVKDSDGKLRVIPWKISADGKTVTRGEHAQADKVGNDISVASLKNGAAVAMRDSDGKLRIITWSATAKGDMGGRRETESGGKISEVDLLTTPNGGSNLTSVVRDSEGEVLIVGWAVDGDGKNLRRVGSSEAGAATRIAVAGVSRSYPGLDPRDMVLTALRDSAGNLKLITWDTNLVNP